MYGYPPPMWGPPPPNYPLPNEDQYQRGMRFAIKLAQREDREKERKKNNERRQKEENRKRAELTRGRFWLSIELFIFGIIAQPFVVVAYNHLLTAVAKAN